MPAYAFVIVAVGWLVWIAPFFLFRPKSGPAQKIDPRARWGVLIVALAYSLLWQASFWKRTPQPWQSALAILYFVLAALLSWTGVRALGRQWRIDAGLNADHELIRSGPYRIVRHPIYTSMLCVFLGTGFVVAPWWLFAIATVIFILGTEIRVRVEDGLLGSRFGEKFSAYRESTRAYLPYIR
jgi:protein-S-isoprenylcysteine O-methyltransferase Ste14